MENTSHTLKTEQAPAHEPGTKIYEAVPRVDTFENKDEICLRIDMPGVEKKDLAVNFDNGVLSISGKRFVNRRGRRIWEEFGDVDYKRRFSVPQTINVERIEADLKDGVLTLHLPKSEAAKPRLIEIKTE